MRLGMHGWCCGDVEIVSLGHDAFKNCFLHVLPFAIGSTSTWIQGLWCWMMCWQQFEILFQGLCFNACNSELSWTQRAFREFQKGRNLRKATQHNRPPATFAIPKFTKRSTDKFRTDESTGWLTSPPGPVGHLAHFQVEWRPPWLTLTRSNGWSNAPNPRPFRRVVVQTRTTPISVTTALIGTGDTNHS